MEYLEFEMGNWRDNVSLMGLMNILDHSGKSYEFSLGKETILVPIKDLEGFEKDYFNYFSDIYEDHLPWARIVNYEKALLSYLENLEEVDEKKLENLNDFIDIVKDYLRRDNYKKVYDLIDEDMDLEEKVKNLKKIRLRKKENIEERLEEVEEEVKKSLKIIDYCKQEDAKKYLRAKGVIYSFINRGMDGVSFLNPQTRERDVFVDYREYFLKTTLDYFEEDKKDYKYQCFSCGGKIKSLNSPDMNLVKDTGFDQTRKSSYIWNHESDFVICPKCLFLYSCFSAGFNYSPYEGIFINANYNLEDLRKVNKELSSNVKNLENTRAASYRALVNSIDRQYERHIDYELNDIQVIRYQDDEYRFNTLSKENLRIIRDSRIYLDEIKNAGFKSINSYFNIYDLVLDRIFNSQNLFSLINYLLVNYISETFSFTKFYNTFHIGMLNNINCQILKEVESVKIENIEELNSFARREGYYLKEEYLKKMGIDRTENRMKSISYRLLNSLKTGNYKYFMDIVLNSYMYVDKKLPMRMSEVINSREHLSIIGYSFVNGLNSYAKKGEKEDEE